MTRVLAAAALAACAGCSAATAVTEGGAGADGLRVPHRALFVIDCRDSMWGVDPVASDPADPAAGETHTQRAAREAIGALLDDGRYSAAVAVVSFSFDAFVLTLDDRNRNGARDEGEGFFTSDRGALLGSGDTAGVIAGLGSRLDGSTVAEALATSGAVVRDELERPEAPVAAESRYSIVLLSELLVATAVEGDALVVAVHDLVGLARQHGIASFDLNAARIAVGTADDAAADALGQRIAEAGRGQFRSFPDASELDLFFAYR